LFTDVQTPKTRYYKDIVYDVALGEFNLIKYFCDEKMMDNKNISIPKINYKPYYVKAPSNIKICMVQKSKDKKKLSKVIKENGTGEIGVKNGLV
jgi:Mg2+/Co2+ transporter CorB